MKKFLIGLATFLVLLFPKPSNAEVIRSFDAEIGMKADASLSVQEIIVYDFEDELRHGIFRTIPVKYRNDKGNFNLRVSNVSAKDEYGRAYPFKTSQSGKNLEIKIGDPDKTITGKHTYVISYTVRRAIGFFPDHEELYWNVTGSDWKVPMERISANVTIPDETKTNGVKTECFSGPYGSREACSSQGKNASSARFTQDALTPGDGVTIVVGVPKGTITKPSTLEEWIWITGDNIIILVPPVTFAVFFYLWRTRGRDPQGKVTIVPQYESPDKLSPVQIATITDFDVHTADLSTIIVDLAVRGYLRIKQTKEPGIFGIGEKIDYVFEKLKEPDASLRPFEKTMMETIFIDSKIQILSTLKSQFATFTEQMRKETYESLVSEGYFPKNPKTIRTAYGTIGVIVIVSGYLLLGILGIIGAICGVLSGIIIIVFSFIMPSRTIKGVLAKEHILGFKEYLSVAERDRIRFHNAPEKNPERFEKLLPFAMALGVEKEWARQFEGIYQNEPSWYASPTGQPFRPDMLASSIRSFSSSANAAISYKPSSASSGGSGFSGGGSGGGFGGGGGGSW